MFHKTTLLSFTSEYDTIQVEDGREVQIVGISLDIAMDITRDADIEIFLPGNIGNLRAKGDGKLRLGVDQLWLPYPEWFLRHPDQAYLSFHLNNWLAGVLTYLREARSAGPGIYMMLKSVSLPVTG